jgi:hypothetical protein
MPFPSTAISISTVQVFRLDPIAGVPLEPLLDIVPGITPLRVTFDRVDQETFTAEYDVTEHAIQDLTDVQSHVHRRPKTLQVVGTLGASPPLVAALPAVPVPPGGLARLDTLRVANLQAMADSLLPVMVTSPRGSLARAFIQSVQQQWSPQNGESLTVSMAFVEAKIASPLVGTLSPDYPAQAPGNNAASGGGQSAAKPVGATATPSDTTGVPPTVGA